MATTQNVGYDVIGHMYLLEDVVMDRGISKKPESELILSMRIGCRRDNRFEYNLGAHVHWLGPTQDHDESFGARGALWTTEGPNLILPSDVGASVYYITNAYNYFLGNAASGGKARYACKRSSILEWLTYMVLL